MGQEANVKKARKELKKAVAEFDRDVNDVRTKIALNVIRRGFFGRLKWFIFGCD